MKPRRDITLGEMQDECKRVKGLCVDGCKFIDVCPNRCDVETRPSKWDLSDPPRFNEAAKAIAGMWFAIGARYIAKDKVNTCVCIDEPRWNNYDEEYEVDCNIWAVDGSLFNLGMIEVLPLAELLGKDGESK